MQYTVVRRLGRGGMGVVDLATAPDGTEVALKRLSLHGTPEEIARARTRIRREADVLRSLSHPAIVRLLDLVDDGDDVVLVMAYLPGGSLHERVTRDGPLEPEAVSVIADRLLDALAAAHRQGVVHRDIKPENVLFAGDGDPRLVDFGVARSNDQTVGLTATSMVVGTPGFMAPEQARGEPASPAADVFSLGATLHFALTGEGPFGPINTDPRVLMHRAASGRVERVPRDLPPDLRHMLSAALEPRPERRPSAARLRGGHDGTSPLTGLAGLAGLTSALRRRWVPVALVTIALIALVATALLVRDGGGDDRADGGAAETTASTEATTTTAPCEPLPFRPCEDGVLGDVAPNTDGERCIDDHEDYDEDPENGCEAAPDGHPDPIELTDEQGSIEATIVPRDDVDEFLLPAEDEPDVFCVGGVTITLAAPEGMTLEMVIVRSDGSSRDAIAREGEEVSERLGEACASSSGDGDITVTVRPIGSDRTGEPYTLSREGSF